MNRQPFPSRIPVGLLLGGALAMASIVPGLAVFRAQQDPVRAHYLKTYVRLSLLPSGRTTEPREFVLLVAANGTAASRPACEPSTRLLLPSATGNLTPELVETAAKCVLVTPPTAVRTWLRGAVYEGQTCAELLERPLLVWALLAVCLLGLGGYFDVRRKQRARNGIQIRGPELVSRWQFNRRVQGDGFPIVLENRRNLLELLQGRVGKVLRIRKRDENKNIICMSDPGGGKTSILMQILDEVERRGATLS